MTAERLSTRRHPLNLRYISKRSLDPLSPVLAGFLALPLVAQWTATTIRCPFGTQNGRTRRESGARDRVSLATYNRAVTISRSALRAVVLVLIALALTIFAGEAIHEIHYVDTHPDAYGPAKVIALACGGGAVLALAAWLALLVMTPNDGAIPRVAFTRADSRRDRGGHLARDAERQLAKPERHQQPGATYELEPWHPVTRGI